MGKNKVSIKLSMAPPLVSVLILLIIKLFVFDMSWWLVFLPLWGPVALLILAFIIIMIIAQFR